MNGQIHSLSKNESFYGINIRSGRIDLKGNELSVGAGGINIYSNSTINNVVGAGSITSIGTRLAFNFINNTNLTACFYIDSEMKNNFKYEVGLVISGGRAGFANHLDFVGHKSNSFTGDVYISGYSGLGLSRNNKSVILGNIFLSKNGYLNISGSHQINDKYSIALNGNSGKPRLAFSDYHHGDIVEKIHSLITKGSGTIAFYVYPWERHSTRHFYLDDIEVAFGSELLIESWALGRDHILVRKDSVHLSDSLSRIKFLGRSEPKASVRDYDNDYWQIIPGFPEPTAYGVILSAATLGLSCYRKQKKRSMKTAALAEN